MTKATVFYDDNCPMCRNLATFAARIVGKGFEFRAATDLGENAVLRVAKDDVVFEGKDAWRYLLEHYPGVRKIGWLATKLGLEEQAAGVMQATGALIRRVCWNCPKSKRRHRRR